MAGKIHGRPTILCFCMGYLHVVGYDECLLVLPGSDIYILGDANFILVNREDTPEVALVYGGVRVAYLLGRTSATEVAWPNI